MVADGEPPRFDEGLNGMTNPCKAGVYSAGGRGRGIEATILARGFDAALCEIPDVGLGAMWDNGRGRYVLLERPRRISAEEGKGWRVRFPDAEILPGSRRRPICVVYGWYRCRQACWRWSIRAWAGRSVLTCLRVKIW